MTTISCATVVNRASIAQRGMRKYNTPSITIYRDSESRRVVEELRMFSDGGAALDTRQMFDFDPKRNRWQTEGETLRTRLDDTRSANLKAKQMLAEIEASDLVPYTGNTHVIETFYPRG